MNRATWSTLTPLASPLDDDALGWGIVGASNVAAKRLLPVLRASDDPLQGNVPIGIFSHSEQRARAFAADHAIPHIYLNLSDMLAQPSIQCIYVGNHPRHHIQSVMAALSAGKHVFCEPPLALDSAEAQRAAHTALSRGLQLAVNFVARTDPAILTLRELLGDQSIGDILGGRISHTALLAPARQAWRLQRPGGGVLLDQTTHSADLLRYLFNDEIQAVYAAASPSLLSEHVEDDVSSQLTLKRRRAIFQLHDSFIVPHKPNGIEIYGSTGTLRVEHLWDKTMPSQLRLYRHGQVTLLQEAAESAYSVAVARFTAAVRHGTGLPSGGSDGVQSLLFVHAATESIQQKRQIDLHTFQRNLIDHALD